ncbi:MAG: hypothetical protein R3Y11_05895 [Pseudomonadota bacterium]
MSTERIVIAIDSLSGFDMLERVRSHNDLGVGLHNDLGDALHDANRALPQPSHDAVIAFESAMQTSQYVVPVSHAQQVDFTNTMAMVDDASLVSDAVATKEAVVLPSPETLLADGVRQLQTGLVDGVRQLQTGLADGASIAPSFTPAEASWMEALPAPERDTFQRGVENLEGLVQSVTSETISQKGLLQLQFAMEEITVYKEIGIQISQKSASSVETVMSQTE